MQCISFYLLKGGYCFDTAFGLNECMQTVWLYFTAETTHKIIFFNLKFDYWNVSYKQGKAYRMLRLHKGYKCICLTYQCIYNAGLFLYPITSIYLLALALADLRDLRCSQRWAARSHLVSGDWESIRSQWVRDEGSGLDRGARKQQQ